LPFDQSGCGKLFTVPSAFDKCVFERGNLLITQKVRLMDEAEDRICTYCRFAMLKPRHVKRPSFLI